MNPSPGLSSPSNVKSWYVLGLLASIYVFNVADRQILAILAQDVKAELRLSDTQLGLLIGPAIGFFYVMLGVPMAYVADRVHRVRFLSICLVIWSLLTAAGGLVHNAIQLALTRIGVSAAEAGGTPCSSSIIADYFAPEKRPLAMGFFSAATVTGIFVAFVIGGWVNEHAGWRGAFIAAGLPGVVLAIILLLTVQEPVRGQRDHDFAQGSRGRMSLPQTVAHLWRIPVYRRTVWAAGMGNFCIHGPLNWGPAFLMRKFEIGSAEVGLYLGTGLALCGGISMILGGALIGRALPRGIAVPLRIVAFFQFLSVPLMIAGLTMPHYGLSLVLIGLAYGCMSFFVPAYWTVAQTQTPPEMRAMAAAITLMVAGIFGGTLLAPFVGAISDYLQPRFGNISLEYALIIVAVMTLIPASQFLWAARAVADPSAKPASQSAA
jgi:MFS family permease